MSDKPDIRVLGVLPGDTGSALERHKARPQFNGFSRDPAGGLKLRGAGGMDSGNAGFIAENPKMGETNVDLLPGGDHTEGHWEDFEICGGTTITVWVK